MSRVIHVVRHAQSEGHRHNRAEFGKEGGALLDVGIAEAKALKHKFLDLGIETKIEPVAISELKRTYQTAMYAGFTNITKYPSLNEVDSPLDPELIENMIKRKELPEDALIRARAILANPPPENIWVTHGLIIAGMAKELGIPPDQLFIPAMGSISTIEIK